MLTDYHLHLRPDETATAEEYFTEENVDRYVAAAEEHGIDELGVSEHVYRFEQALEIWTHPYWEGQARDDLDAYCEFVRTTPLRLGIECRLRARQPRTGSRICSSATSTTWSARFTTWAPTEPSMTSATTSGRASPTQTSCGAPTSAGRPSWFAPACFDVVSHPDLVKMWGSDRPAPQRDPRFHYEPLVEAIGESGIAVEVSTAGLRKPVGEIYPSRALAEMCVEVGAEFALSSDAHSPDQVGYAYDDAIEFLGSLGVEQHLRIRGPRAPARAAGTAPRGADEVPDPGEART